MQSGPAVPVIDVHTHPILASWTKAYDKMGLPRVGGLIQQEGMSIQPWTCDVSLDAMETCGIQAMIMSFPPGTQIMHGAEAKDLARAMNEEMASIIRTYPDRFGAFAVLPLDDIDAAIAEMAYALDILQLEGICLPTNVNGVYLGDPRFTDLLAECDRRRATLFVHPLSPYFFDQVGLPYNPAAMEFMFDTTRTLASLVYSGARQRFQNFRLISTHGGGAIPYLSSRLTNIATHPAVNHGINVTDPSEVAAGFRSFYYDLTASTASTSLGSMMQFIGPEKLLMGTDSPIVPMPGIQASLNALANSPLLNQEQRDMVASQNALRLFPRLSEAVWKNVPLKMS